METETAVKESEGRFLHGPLTRQILGCAIEVHRTLGPGLLESAYRDCLLHELRTCDLAVKREVRIPLKYKGCEIESAFRADIVVADRVLLELKSVESFAPLHTAQVLTYLKFLDLKVGLLVNFNVTQLMKGVRRYAL